MRKLVSPLAGKVMGINVKVGQVITEDDEVLIIETMKKDNGGVIELDEYEEFPRYQMLYEYFTCSYLKSPEYVK